MAVVTSESADAARGRGGRLIYVASDGSLTLVEQRDSDGKPRYLASCDG